MAIFPIEGPTLSAAFRKIEQAHIKAAVRSVNRIANSVRSAGVRAIAKDLGGIRQKSVRDATRINKANNNRVIAEVVARGKRIPLHDLKARQVRRGVRYKLGPETKIIAAAFIARMQSGHVGVFTRIDARRLPIQEKFGPSIPRIFTRRVINKVMHDVVKDRWPKEMESALKFYLR